MLIKAYFDGGNQADSTRYEVVTLAAVSGTPSQWLHFNADWQIVLKKHGAVFLHTKALFREAEPLRRRALAIVSQQSECEFTAST